MDSIIPLGQKNTLAEYMILSGANNRPPMLDKDLYDSWKSRMELYMQNREHERMILKSVENVRLLRERNQDPLAFVANQQMTPPHFNTYQSSYNNPQLQQQFPPSQYGSIYPNQHYSSSYPQLQFNHSSVISSYPYQSQMNHQTLSVPQIGYQLPQVTIQPMTESPLMDSSFSVPVFSPRDDPIACLNKSMAFLTSVASLRFPSTNNQLRTSFNLRNKPLFKMVESQCNKFRGDTGKVILVLGIRVMLLVLRETMQADRQVLLNATTVKEKAMLAEAQEAGQILDEEQLAFLADLGVPDGQAVQTIIPNNAAFQTEDLDTYDFDCDDISKVKAVLMTNISNYGSEVISEVPHSETYLNDIENQSVHAMKDFEQTPVVDFTDNEIHSDSNIIPYSQYLQETQQTNEKANKEQNNESVTAELERYKERVKTFEQRLNIDLSSREKMIDSQMDDMIKEKLALKEQVDSLEQNLSKQIKEKECLLQTFTVFKSESKEKEDKYMENEIDLEKKIKELDNILFKVGQSAQTVHMLTKPQAFYDNIHKQALGYQNPFYLRKAQRIKPTLYDGIVISDKHVAMPVIDDEETLILEEKSRSKMSEKGKDPKVIKKNISHKPIDYEKLNRLSEDFGKRFTPQQEMDAEQAFWFRISNPTIESSNPPPVKVEVPSELPKVSLVNASLKKLKFHLAQFDSVVKKRTTPDARTEGEWGFEHTKAVFNNEIIPFLKSLKDIFNVFDRDLLNEIMEVKTVFEQMDAVVQQSSVDKQFEGYYKMREKSKKENVKYEYCEIATKNVELENSVAKLLSENEHLCNEINHVKQVFKEQFDSIKKTRVRTKEQSNSLIDKLNLKSVENEDLKAQIQDKVFMITSLKNDLQKVKGKEIVGITAQIPSANTIVPGMFKLDLEPLAPSAKKVVVTPKNKVKKVRFAEPLTSSSNIKQVESSKTSDSNTPVLSSTGLKCSTSKCGSKPTGNKRNDRISQTPSRNMKNKVEAQPRKVNKKNRVVEPIRDINVKHSLLNANSEPICATCKKSMFDGVHDMCILDFVENVNSRAKSAKKHKKQNIWKPTGHVFTEVGLKWKPTGRTFTIVGNSCPLTRITSANVVPPKKTTSDSVETQKPELKVYSRKPKNIKNIGSSKKAKIVESKIANHSEPNHTWGSNARDIPSSSSLVMTVRFGNDNIARIMGYGDYQLGNVTISRVYYVKGLGHNLLSVGQFCDANIKVTFWKNTCFIHNLEGVDLLYGSRDTNLYTISLDDMLKTSPICLLSKASKTKSWLWHRRLSHLNFACALGKSKKSSHQPKADDTNQEKLYLFHMDLCGPMRMASINGKRYILVIVDDYSRFTWVRFLRTKDEAPEAIIKCIKNIQVCLNATVRNVRTNNGTEFFNQTLREFYENVGISHQTFVTRTPQQNGVVERQNRTLIEATRTMLIVTKAPLLLLAEAINTACYTQNRSIIRRRYNKTPYELMQDKKPDLSFFHVFGALCYPTNDNDDLGKLDAKADIGIFVGYAPAKKVFRIYNKRTRKIIETIHVTFDELATMAFEQFSSRPGLHSMTPATSS
ncbi:retrovirus-related pol polyprotein from transposon TNT 1-94 [Tanacetum coccineum]